MLRPPKVTKCKSCGAEIFFGQQGTKYIPLDAEPVAYIDPTDELPKTETLFTMGGTPFPAVTGDDIPDYVDTFRWAYRNHFVTCPAAREHRKPKAKRIESDGQETLFGR